MRKNVSCIYSSDIALSAELKNQFEAKILAWIDSTQSVLFFSGKPSYKLLFSLHNNEVICDLDIAFKFRKWCSRSVGKDPLDAFYKAFNTLSLSGPLQRRSKNRKNSGSDFRSDPSIVA